MEFWRKLLAKAIIKKAEEVAMYNGMISLSEKLCSVNASANTGTNSHMLFIKKKVLSIKRKFIVYDKFNTKKYIIKIKVLTFGYPCICLYDIENNEIGKVELSSKAGMGIYSMYLDGKKLGTLSRKMSVKIGLSLNFNGWYLNGNLIQNNFVVTDKAGNNVMAFYDVYTARDTYVLEMSNYQYEILGLLLVMAVEIALHS